MSHRDNRGFSLMELMVVVMIAGMILAISAPPIGRYLERQKVYDAARQVATEIRLARSRAVANDYRYHIWIGYSGSDRQYWWGEQKRSYVPATQTWSYQSTVWHGPYALPSGIKQVTPNFGGSNTFFYDPSGKASAGGSVKFVNTRTTTDTVTVNVDLAGGVW